MDETSPSKKLVLHFYIHILINSPMREVREELLEVILAISQTKSIGKMDASLGIFTP